MEYIAYHYPCCVCNVYLSASMPFWRCTFEIRIQWQDFDIGRRLIHLFLFFYSQMKVWMCSTCFKVYWHSRFWCCEGSGMCSFVWEEPSGYLADGQLDRCCGVLILAGYWHEWIGRWMSGLCIRSHQSRHNDEMRLQCAVCFLNGYFWDFTMSLRCVFGTAWCIIKSCYRCEVYSSSSSSSCSTCWLCLYYFYLPSSFPGPFQGHHIFQRKMRYLRGRLCCCYECHYVECFLSGLGYIHVFENHWSV